MDVFEGKSKRHHKQLTDLIENKVLRNSLRAALFVVSFANFKSSDPSGDRVMPRAERRVRAQACHGNITVLRHLKRKCFIRISRLKFAKV